MTIIPSLRVQVLRNCLDSSLELGSIDQGQATVGADTNFLEGTLGVGVSIILLMCVLQGTGAHSIALEYLVLGVEEELLGGLACLLLFLLRPRLFKVELGFDFLVVLRDDHVVREVVRFFVLDGPGHLLKQHVVHGRDDLGGHVDHSLGQDQADRGHWGLRDELVQGGKGGVGGGFGLDVLGQFLDDGLVL